MRMAVKTCAFALLMSVAPLLRADEPKAPPAPVSTEPGIIDWSDAAKSTDREVIVQGRIVQTGKTAGITFLNFDMARSMSAIVRQRNYRNFQPSADEMYRGKFVRIRGTITEYRGKPQIEVARPDQVTILEKEESIPEGRAARPLPPPRKREFKGVVSVASYNIENLFDAHDDPYRNDEGTDPKPEIAMAKAARVIRALDADIVALQEVENRGVLEQFVKSRLSDMGYRNIVLFEGNDGRGIDCALLTWLPVGKVSSYRHVEFSDGSGGRTTFRRDLLRVRIEPPEYPAFDVFVVHLKCCGGPDDLRVRGAEATAIRRIVDDILKESPDERFLICGDFNDRWDSEAMKAIRGSGSTELTGFLTDLPSGTVTYHKPPFRSIIDHIVASPAMAKLYVPNSYNVFTNDDADGASDHYPVVAQFDLNVVKSATTGQPEEQKPNVE